MNIKSSLNTKPFLGWSKYLLDIAVKMSLKDYWHLPKEVDYSLTLLVSVLGQSLTLFISC